MNYISKVLGKLKKKKPVRLLSPSDAYSLWSASYDSQPDNVVLYLENKLFSEIISQTELKNKNVLDIGCGTGRHWAELYKKNPAKLTGTDNSGEMLEKLKKKFPAAEVILSNDNSLKSFEDNSFDVIISTLTTGHVKEIEKYFNEWNRVLKPTGQIIMNDFHPDAFAAGMKRTFIHKGEVIEVENNLYTIEYLKTLFDKLNWKILNMSEKIIDDEVEPLFEKQNYMKAFNKYKGTPLILGFHLSKK